jgi:hypothetical protein
MYIPSCVVRGVVCGDDGPKPVSQNLPFTRNNEAIVQRLGYRFSGAWGCGELEGHFPGQGIRAQMGPALP